jgi:2'-5' RNA ligase
MRVFFAALLDFEVTRSIQRAIEQIPLLHPPWRWIAPENLHVTLRFIGETPEDTIDRLVASAADACREEAEFTIQLGGLGGFPNLARPRVLFYRVRTGADRFQHLVAGIDRALFRRMGIPPEQRAFRAHVTIARIKTPLSTDIIAHLEAAPDLSEVSQTVQRVSLMMSELRRQGVKYHVLKEIALQKP